MRVCEDEDEEVAMELMENVKVMVWSCCTRLLFLRRDDGNGMHETLAFLTMGYYVVADVMRSWSPHVCWVTGLVPL